MIPEATVVEARRWQPDDELVGVTTSPADWPAHDLMRRLTDTIRHPPRRVSHGRVSCLAGICITTLGLACAVVACAQSSPAESMPAHLFEGPVRTGEQAAVSYEGESFADSRLAHARGGHAIAQDMRAFGSEWSGNAQLFFAARGRGSRLVLELPTLVPAKYRVDLYLTRAPDYGRLRINLEAGEKPIDFDGYAPGVERAAKLQVGEALSRDGRLLLDVTVIGRHRESRGYLAGIDRIVLVPLSAPATP